MLPLYLAVLSSDGLFADLIDLRGLYGAGCLRLTVNRGSVRLSAGAAPDALDVIGDYSVGVSEVSIPLTRWVKVERLTGNSSTILVEILPHTADKRNVTATLSDGGVRIGEAWATKKRAPYPPNYIPPAYNITKSEKNGTVMINSDRPRTIMITATATGSECRAFAVVTLYNLDPLQWYEFAIGVQSISLASFMKVAPCVYVNSGVSAGGGQINWNAMPAAGSRGAIRFKPAASTTSFRIGFGGLDNETVTSGDTVTLVGPTLYPVSSALDAVVDYSDADLGVACRWQPETATLGSCVYAIGDSWGNDGRGAANGPEFPFWLGVTHGRECIVTGMPGKRLDEIVVGVQSRIAAGNSGLNLPCLHAPGVWAIYGAINSWLADYTGAQIFAAWSQLSELARLRGAAVVTILQPFASDYGGYSAGRMAQRNAYAALLAAAGARVIDLQSVFCNADGTANLTYFAADKLHPNQVGSQMLAALIDSEIQKVDAGYPVIFNPPRFVIP